MTPETATGDLRELLRPPIERTANGGLVVSSHGGVLREAVLAVADAGGDAPEHVRLLGTERALSEATDDFHVAARAADLLAADAVSIRADGTDHLPSVVVSAGEAGGSSRRSGAGEVGDRSRQLEAGEVTTISPLAGREAVSIRTDDAEAVGAVRDAVERAFADATEYRVSTPGYDRLLSSLESVVGADVRADVATVLGGEATVRSSDSTLDEIDTVLLMGGRNGAQLFELSEWAERIGVASRATMSSRKRRLESAGLLATEKVSTDVGRPRQRLLVAPEDLRDATPTDLVRAARSVLVGE